MNYLQYSLSKIYNKIGVDALLRRLSYVSWAVIDQGVVSSANFVTGILLARIMGVDEFGRYVLAWTVVLFAQSIQNAAILAPMLSIGPKYDGEAAREYFDAAILRQRIYVIASALVSWSGLKIAAVVTSIEQLHAIAFPVAVAVLVSQTQEFVRRYYFAAMRPKRSLVADTIRYCLQVCLIIIISHFSEGTMSTEAALWIGIAAATAGCLVWDSGWLRWPNLGKSLSAADWHYSKWLIASSLMGWVTGNFIFVVVGAQIGVAAVAGLRAIQTLVGTTHLLYMALENAIPSEASRIFAQRGYSRSAVYLLYVMVAGGGVTALVAGILAISSEFWLGLLFGPQFIKFGALVKWWAVIEVFAFIIFVAATWLRTLEKTRIIFAANAGAALVLIAAIYPLIKYFALQGAVAGIIVAQLASLAVYVAAIRADFNQETHSPHR
jgi:O-antigen/teichoic acid export membrane protein